MTAIYIATPADISIKCIRTLWSHRASPEARRAIRHHIFVVRRHRGHSMSRLHRALYGHDGRFRHLGIPLAGNR